MYGYSRPGISDRSVGATRITSSEGVLPELKRGCYCLAESVRRDEAPAVTFPPTILIGRYLSNPVIYLFVNFK